MANFTSVVSVAGASFAASFVEAVEALTVVLAVGLARGWRPALTGAAAALTSLALMVAVLGPLIGRIPIYALQAVVGVLLLLFGLRWLRKAILRSIGTIPLHDEDAAFARETREFAEAERRRLQGLDWIAGVTAFKAVLLKRGSRSSSSSSPSAPAASCGSPAPAPRPPASPWRRSAGQRSGRSRRFPKTR